MYEDDMTGAETDIHRVLCDTVDGRTQWTYFHDSGLTFVWSGGPYIDLWIDGASRVSDLSINVWDYETDTPTIPVSPEGLKTTVDEWVSRSLEDLKDAGYLPDLRNVPRISVPVTSPDTIDVPNDSGYVYNCPCGCEDDD